MPDLQTARTKFQADLKEALTTALNWPGPEKPVVLVTAPGGVGKTHTTAQLLTGHRVTWFGERNDMMHQLQSFLSLLIAGVAPLGPPGFVPRIEKQIARRDPGACSQYAARVEPLEKQHLARYTEAMACRGCPDQSKCMYQNFKPSKEWLFAPHVWLGLDVDHRPFFKGRDIVVIDESPMSEMLGGVTLSRWEIDQLLAGLRIAGGRKPINLAGQAFVAIFEQALEVLRDPPPGRKRVELRKLAADLGYQFVGQIPSVNQMGRTQPQSPHLQIVDPRSVGETMRSLPHVARGARPKLVQLADALAADIQKRPACVLVLPDASDKIHGGIAAGHFRPLPVPDDLPLVILDATGDELRYWCQLRTSPGATPRTIIRVTAEVDQVSPIYQTVDHRYPSTTFSHPKSTTIDRLMNIVDIYKGEHPTDTVGLVVKKELFKNNMRFRQRVLQTVPDEKDIKFFWALRGDNSLADYNAIFIIGAPELDSLEAEALVRAYMTRLDPLPDEDPYDYKIVSRPISSHVFPLQDIHGRFVSLEERGYAGTEQYAVSRLHYQDEFIQAILRGRPYDPAKKKNIYFLSSSYLTLLDIQFVSEADLLHEDLWVRAKQKLDAEREAGKHSPFTWRELARMLGVDESTVSKARRKDPQSWGLLLT